MNKLEKAAQQALEALELAGMSHDVMLMSDPPQDAWKARGVNWKLAEAMNALRAALAEEQNENTVQSTGGIHSRVFDRSDRGVEAVTERQDWDEIEALRASLREHMAEIHRLRAAGRQALEALEAAEFHAKRRIPDASIEVVVKPAITALRDALKEQIECKQFMYFENQDGGMDTFMVSSEQDFHHLYRWMKTAGTFDCSQDDQEMVDWMKVADIGEVHFHRLGCLVRLKDKK